MTANTFNPATEREPNRPLRIACYGFVERGAGSVASANLEVLTGLLKRGHEIDFFSKRSFVYPRELFGLGNFRYVDCPNRKVETLCRKAAGAGEYIQWLLGRLDHATSSRAVVRAMRIHHRDRKYELQLFLGTWGFGRIFGVPTLSWVQGPPETDSRSVNTQRRMIKDLCGMREYLKLKLYTYHRASIGRSPFHKSDGVICGSQWSRTVIATYGVDAERIFALPYPIDLKRFCPEGRPSRGKDARQTILWLGRIVPRKRLDLFLDACALLIKTGQPLHVRIVGGFPFAGGYRKLIDRFPYPESLEYSERMDRDGVPALMRAADVVVQPSEEENFGSTIAEALACGTPVVVGPTNGTGDFIENAGEAFDQYDAASLAGAIGRVLGRLKSEGSSLLELSRNTAEAMFAVNRVVDGLEQIMRQTVRVAGRKDGDLLKI